MLAFKTVQSSLKSKSFEASSDSICHHTWVQSALEGSSSLLYIWRKLNFEFYMLIENGQFKSFQTLSLRENH